LFIGSAIRNTHSGHTARCPGKSPGRDFKFFCVLHFDAYRCHLERYASRGLRFAYRVSRGKETLATGATEHVWVETASGKPCRTPEPIREGFARLAGGWASADPHQRLGERSALLFPFFMDRRSG
jgi:hypothetical protein